MSWQKALADAYDACSRYIDYEHNDGTGLCPVAHQPINVNIDIFIDDRSGFVRAQKIEETADENGYMHPVKIFAPSDEAGSTRTSRPSPKALTDRLCYICGDFSECFPKDRQSDHAEEAHQNYMNSMKKWIDFGAPDEISIIYAYLQKNTTMKDILKCTDKVKTDDTVRFTVIRSDSEIVRGTWQSREIAESFIRFCTSAVEKTGFDIVAGKNSILSGSAQAQIRNSGDRAKLFSSNDSRNFTYRGGYIKKPEDCITIGYEASQKITNALRYLIQKQGIRNGNERIVCFTSGTGQTVSDVWNIFGGVTEDTEETSQLYAERVRKAVSGCFRQLKPDEKITVIGVSSADDSASGDMKGRLAVTRYYEISQNSFFDSVIRWYETCRWRNSRGVAFTPAPHEIADAAYGIYAGGKLKAKDEYRKRVRNAVMNCTLENRKLPRQIVSSIMQSAKNPQKYDEAIWRRIITAALAVLSRYEYDYKGEMFEMELNRDREDRSYQFGRLLAVLERIEDSANYKKENTHRTTNAVKNWKSFTLKPAYTFSRIHKKIMPYMESLSAGSQNAYKNMISEIIEKIDSTDGFTNEKLEDTYLAGYYLQRRDMIEQAVENSKRKESEKEEEK